MSKVILVVEDNKDDQLFLVANLKNPQLYSIECVPDGAAAIQYLKNNPLPTVLILDLSLPKMSGFDVITEVRKDNRLKNLPVVMLTSSKELSDIEKAYSLGCNSYLVKPIVYEELRSLIRKAAEYWTLHNVTSSNISPSREKDE
jgi:two-component system, response regulator